MSVFVAGLTRLLLIGGLCALAALVWAVITDDGGCSRE